MNRIIESVQRGNFDLPSLIKAKSTSFTELKIAVENFNNNLTQEACAKFLSYDILPHLFVPNIDEDNEDLREKALELGFALLKHVNITHLSSIHQDILINRIQDEYIKVLHSLRDNTHKHWHKLWIFLVKFCNVLIHTKVWLANSLLKVVEKAFRNSSSLEQRVQAYDCWMALIDNSSLNMSYMLSQKQIKLLATPLKAKFTRTPILTTKRFEAFLYLLKKLEDRADVCLRDFLEYCFAPFDDNEEKLKQGKSIPKICANSCKALMAIIGHSHDNEDCVNNDCIQFTQPIINSSNFPGFVDILVKSVGECSILLHGWITELHMINNVVKCLWRSLLKHIDNSDTDTKVKACIEIHHFLRKLQTFSEKFQNKQFYQLVLANISEEIIPSSVLINLYEIVYDISLNLLHNNLQEKRDCNSIINFVKMSLQSEDMKKFVTIFHVFLENHIKDVSSEEFCEIWLKYDSNSLQNTSVFIWAIRNFDNFTDRQVLLDKWSTIFNNQLQSDGLKIQYLQEMENFFLNNPLIGINVIPFLSLCKVNDKMSKEYATKFMKVLGSILSYPNLTEDRVNIIGEIILSCLNPNFELYKGSSDELINKICCCLNQIFIVHKNYLILPKLGACLEKFSEQHLTSFTNYMPPFLQILVTDSDFAVSKCASDIFKLLENRKVSNDTPPRISNQPRALKILNLSSPTASITNPSLKIFGSEIESPPSVPRLRSSLVNKTEPNRRSQIIMQTAPMRAPRKARKSFPSTVASPDEKSSDFVKIDTVVKIDKSKLTEHQREILERRPDKVVAFYNDLSQSQSQSVLSATEDDAVKNGVENITVDKSPQDCCVVLEKCTKAEDVEEKTPVVSESEIQLRKSERHIKKKLLVDCIMEHEKLKMSRKVRKNREDTPKGSSSDKKMQQPSIDSIFNAMATTPNKTEEPQDETQLTPKTSETSPKEGATLPMGRRRRSRRDTDQETKSKTVKTEEIPPKKSIPHSKTDDHEEIPLQTSYVALNIGEATPETGVHGDSALKIAESLKAVSQESEARLKSEEREKSTTKTPESSQSKSAKPVRSARYKSKCPFVNSSRVRRKRTNQNLHLTAESAKTVNSNNHKEESEDVIESSQFTGPKNIEKTVVDSHIPGMKGDNKIKRKRLDSFKGNSVVVMDVDNTENDTTKVQLVNTKEDSVQVDNIIIKLDDDKSAAVTENCTISMETPNIIEATNETPDIAKANEDVILPPLTRSRLNSNNNKRNEMSPDLFSTNKTQSQQLIRVRSLEALTGRSLKTPTKVTRSKSLDSLKISQYSPIKSRHSPKILDSTTAVPSTSETISIEANIGKSLESLLSKDYSAPIEANKNDNVNDTLPDTETIDIASGADKSPVKRVTDVAAITDVTANSELSLAATETIESDCLTERRITRSLSPLLDVNKRITRSSPDKLKSRALINIPNSPTKKAINFNQSDRMKSESFGDQNLVAMTPTPINKKTSIDLPSSPVTCNTPDKTSELLNNTLDISPITSGDDNSDDAPPVQISQPIGACFRGSRLLKLANSNASLLTPQPRKKWVASFKPASPNSTGKINRIKMRIRKEDNLDYLTFSREIPSPLVTPASGILKRKFNDVDDVAATPSPKRKRVNFSDPATTQKKLFIKDVVEYDDETDKSAEDGIPDDILHDFQNFVQRIKLKNNSTNCLNKLFLESIQKDEIVQYLMQNAEPKDMAKLIETINSEDDETINEICSELNDSSKDNVIKMLLTLLEKPETAKIFIDKLKDKLDNVTQVLRDAFAVTMQQQPERHQEEPDKLTTYKHLRDDVFNSLESDQRDEFLFEMLNYATNKLQVNGTNADFLFDLQRNYFKKIWDK